MRWHGDDGVDDSLLVGNHREERVITKQLNYSAISPRQRRPRRGSSPELIWEMPAASGGPASSAATQRKRPHSRRRRRGRGQEMTGERRSAAAAMKPRERAHKQESLWVLHSRRLRKHRKAGDC